MNEVITQVSIRTVYTTKQASHHVSMRYCLTPIYWTQAIPKTTEHR